MLRPKRTLYVLAAIVLLVGCLGSALHVHDGVQTCRLCHSFHTWELPGVEAAFLGVLEPSSASLSEERTPELRVGVRMTPVLLRAPPIGSLASV